ncbi:MAG: putative alpha/beta-fold hydrolase [Moritella sp.]|jgi:predicted alpha/beta-fold hydrolase
MFQTSQFQPQWWIRNAHLQTMLPTLNRRNLQIDSIHERLELEDGDFLDLAWTEMPETAGNKPIVIIFHGLEGSVESPYIKGIMRAVKAAGWVGLLMHFRGCSHESNRLLRAYHSGDTADAEYVIALIAKRYPQSPLFAIGYSLGGSVLTHYLAQKGKHSLLVAAAIVSAPLLLAESAERIKKGFSKAYQRRLIKLLQASILRKFEHLDMTSALSITPEQVKKLNTFVEFDDQVTAPLHGFKDALDYYKQCSGLQYLYKIQTPTLFIHAEDDPFLTKKVIPTEANMSEQISFELSKYGGHVGFVYGSILKPKYWLEERIPNWFKEFTPKPCHIPKPDQGTGFNDDVETA